jgi:hypothetical protein
MPTPEKLIADLEDTIAEALDRFNGRLPKVEQDMYARILELSADLETDKGGRIKPSMKNIRLIGKIKEELTNTIFDSQYKKELANLIDTYDKVSTIQAQYFTSVAGKFTAPAIVKEVQKLAIESVTDQLGREAMGVNISAPIRAMLNQAITTGGTRKEFTEQARKFLLAEDGGKGTLTKYASLIATDSLNTYSATYNSLLTDDLGFVWFKYSGSLKETSRDFCRELIDASGRGDCLEYIHISQIPALLEGHICDVTIPLYDKTGLPEGMKDGTNTANFRINRGGWNCNHQLSGVPTAIVPKRLRDLIPE